MFYVSQLSLKGNNLTLVILLKTKSVSLCLDVYEAISSKLDMLIVFNWLYILQFDTSLTDLDVYLWP